MGTGEPLRQHKQEDILKKIFHDVERQVDMQCQSASKMEKIFP